MVFGPLLSLTEAYHSTPRCKRQGTTGSQRTWEGGMANRSPLSLLITCCHSPAPCVSLCGEPICSSHRVQGKAGDEASNLLARECGLTAPAHCSVGPGRSLGQPAPSPVLERTLPGLLPGSFFTRDIREWELSPVDVMTLFSLITLVINRGLAPSGQVDLRSEGGTSQGFIASPLRLLCPTHFMCTPVRDRSHGPSSFSCPGSRGEGGM